MVVVIVIYASEGEIKTHWRSYVDPAKNICCSKTRVFCAESGAPTFLYYMTHALLLNHDEAFGPTVAHKPDYNRADHTDDTQFIFGYPSLPRQLKDGYRFANEERRLSLQMVTYFTNFARNVYALESFNFLIWFFAVTSSTKKFFKVWHHDFTLANTPKGGLARKMFLLASTRRMLYIHTVTDENLYCDAESSLNRLLKLPFLSAFSRTAIDCTSFNQSHSHGGAIEAFSPKKFRCAQKNLFQAYNKTTIFTPLKICFPSKSVVLNLFCHIYPSTKSKNWFYLQQCVVCQGLNFLERVRGSFWKNVANSHSDIWTFVLTGNNFRLMLVWNYQFLRWSFNTRILQASMDTFMKWFAEFVENLKTISCKSAYHWIKRQNVWKKECTAVKFFFF